jgi:phosphoglucosamine mutase
MSTAVFGTDGIRGRVGEYPITADFVLKLGWAAGKVLTENFGGKKHVLIGKDTRVSGYMFESALEAGLIAAGVDVGMLGPMPTPAVAYLTRAFRASAGIVISASHNPYHDNGIKFFGPNGFKLPDEVEREIENLLSNPLHTNSSEQLGKASRITDAAGRYVEFCKASLPNGFSLSEFRLVVDCANGATYGVAPKVFGELGADVVSIGSDPDGFNINAECGSMHLSKLQNAVLENKADLGIALDGDGDRVMMVDHKGEIVDGDELIFILAYFRKKVLGACNGVAGTLMTNLGLEHALSNLKIPFERTKVGDRYVIEALLKNGWSLGGEASGHLLCSDVNTTGDGIIGALQVIRALAQQEVKLHRAKQGMSKFPQRIVNVPRKRNKNLAKNKPIQTAIARAEEQLNGKGRILLRPSGTEPFVRVMVEGDDKILVRSLADDIADAVRRFIA